MEPDAPSSPSIPAGLQRRARQQHPVAPEHHREPASPPVLQEPPRPSSQRWWVIVGLSAVVGLVLGGVTMNAVAQATRPALVAPDAVVEPMDVLDLTEVMLPDSFTVTRSFDLGTDVVVTGSNDAGAHCMQILHLPTAGTAPDIRVDGVSECVAAPLRPTQILSGADGWGASPPLGLAEAGSLLLVDSGDELHVYVSELP